MNFFRDKILQLRPGSLLAAAIRLSAEDQQKYQAPEFLVFQARVTDKFEIEQTGSGFPCKDEAKAKEVVQIIEEKNQTVPAMMLVSWQGGFCLGAMSKPEAWYEDFILYRYPKPQKFGNQLSVFSLRLYKLCLSKPPEMVKEEMLPTTDPAVAHQLFQKRSAEIKAETLSSQNNPANADDNITKQSAALKESQMLVLAKAFPETIKLFQSPQQSKREEVDAAYKRDIFVLTGKMYEPLTFNQEQFWKTATSIHNPRRDRKRKKGIDPLEYELVVGWFFRGYGKMTPQDRVAALKARGFIALPSSEVIRKICKKLKLPSLRKPGRH